MNEEEKFDELLSSKLSERDFPFDELNWDEAERLIIQQERRRKMLRFGLIFSGGLAAGVMIMLPFILGNHSTLPNNIAITAPAGQHIVTDNNLPSVTSPKITTNNTTNKEDKAPLPVQSAFVKKESSTGIRGTSSNVSHDIKTTKENKTILLADINQSHRNHKLKAVNNFIASARKTKNKPIHSEALNRVTPVANQEQTNTTSVATINATIPKNSSANGASTNATTTSPPNPVNPTTINTSSNKTIAINNTGTAGNTPPKGNTTANAITKKDSNDKEPLMLPGTTPNIVDDYSKNILSAYAGGNYSLGWKNEGTSEGKGITLLAGFSFTHYFIRTFSASIGVGYSELTNLNKTYTSNEIQYDFGANATVTTVTPQTAYYIAVPLKLQANWDSKDQVGLGLDYLLLLTTNCTLTTYQQNYFSQTTPTTEKQNGYTQGFANSDIQVTLAYTRMFTDRLGLTAEYYHDLSYIENSSFPGINGAYPKNNGFRLILSYQLMK